MSLEEGSGRVSGASGARLVSLKDEIFSVLVSKLNVICLVAGSSFDLKRWVILYVLALMCSQVMSPAM